MITCPDLILNGSSGYCKTNFRFIQTATTLLDNQVTMLQSRLNWLWFPMADWSSTQEQESTARYPRSAQAGEPILSYKKAPPLLNLTISATPSTLTIYPGSSKTSLITIDSVSFAGFTNLTNNHNPVGTDRFHYQSPTGNSRRRQQHDNSHDKRTYWDHSRNL